MRTVIKHAGRRLAVAVNGVLIADADIAREVQNHTGASPKEAWDSATRALIVRELLLQRARALDLVAKPRSQDGLRETEEEALIRTLLETDVHIPTADETTCRRYYLANQARFRGPDLYEPVHILFKAPRDDQPAYDQAIARAEAVLAELRVRPDDFESIAQAVSDCPSAADGGRLRQVTRDDITPEFETALRSMEPGTICPHPVCTRYGVHVVRLDRKVLGEVLPFARVCNRIAAYLDEGAWCRAVAQYVAMLAGQAKISGFTVTGGEMPTVSATTLLAADIRTNGVE
jgi:peptidyl-prolyl cis-trans isomerase C